MSNFSTDEEQLSQIPAVQLLINLGYEYLTQAETLRERQGKTANVLLETVLSNQLKEINRIRYKSGHYPFSEENIHAAVQKLKNIKYDGLLQTNQAIYDLLTLGTALEQSIEGNSKSFTLNYIDWRNPSRNRFQVTIEYRVARSKSTETVRPDIVLFVNGIPFCVIECKAPKIALEQAISQNIRNQNQEHIPKLFIYSQMVLALNKNKAMYATTGTEKKFWSAWKEPEHGPWKTDKATLMELKNKPLSPALRKKIEQSLHGQISTDQSSFITAQDEALYALCRPERLLELAWKFTIFEGQTKKIARYQQYFVIQATLQRVRHFTKPEGHPQRCRKGGIVWHTQGSGKSLTMVMLARNMVLNPEIKNPRIVLVTDRDDLDRQLRDTFKDCGLEVNRATSSNFRLDNCIQSRSVCQ